jgi:DNA-3-methyladenine glycosylase II
MIRIEPLGPYSWQQTADAFANFAPMSQHSTPRNASVSRGPRMREGSQVIPMAFPLDGDFTPTAVAIGWTGAAVIGEVAGTRDLERVSRQVARIISLDHDARAYPEVGRRDPAVGRLMEALPGLRPLCFSSPYETAAWGVISQRISMRQAAAIKARLLEEHGHRLRVGGHEVISFPTPERLARVTTVSGLSGEKTERLRGVAEAALSGLLDAERLRALGPLAGPDSVRAIPGIGPFWASGIYLRGCGIVDEFAMEPISVAALGHLHGLGDRPSEARLSELTDRYRPFRMWVCYLLRVAAGRKGLIPGVAGREMSLRRAAAGARSG